MDRFEYFTVAVTEISYHVHRLMNEALDSIGARLQELTVQALPEKEL